ncbi:hypothetical protein DL96DRAFT_1630878 [Flagelloscypha sp. PMI_526]|nr:hypothetical protein DL96DRAFT_1630878 [Flagelloscypha sp. PMI_526]
MDREEFIPLEILENVLEFLPRKQDLGTCGLVWPGLLRRARAKLFGVVTLVSSQDIQSFHAHLLWAPQLIPFVHHLGVLDVEQYFGGIWVASDPDVLAKIFSLLKGNVKTVTFFQEKYHGFQWINVPDDLKSALIAIANDPACEGMDLQFYGHSANAIECLPTIRHLELYSPRELFSSSSSSTIPLRLQSFRVSFATNRRPKEDFFSSHSLFDFSHLERLIVDPNIAYRLSPRANSSSDSSACGPWVTLLARAGSATLVELYWEIGAFDTTVPDIRLSELPNLKNLNIGFSSEADQPECSARCKMLLTFLSSRAPLRPINNGTFSYEVADLEDAALIFFIRDLTGVANASIGFVHQTIKDRLNMEAYSLLQATASARADCCIQVVDPNKSFGNWVEVRRHRPYGHVVSVS